MIVRIWRTGVDRSRIAEYARFEEERSLPMFCAQPGLIGVFFLREGEDRAAALTLWEDMAAVEALAISSPYPRTVQEPVDTGLLTGGQSVDIFYIHGGRSRWEELSRWFLSWLVRESMVGERVPLVRRDKGQAVAVERLARVDCVGKFSASRMV
jgi:heme-degrading monooxygenase HmoA